jgi:thymidylate synthase ThyX
MSSNKRVLTVAPMPPEKLAYALARYSRSPDSVRESVDWVRNHDSRKFLESFYFQYGHASIADLGHLALCFEGVSELAACEIEDEQLWDGQARSSRYQDFSRSGFITPLELDAAEARVYQLAAENLLSAYKKVHAAMFEHLSEKLPRPADMKPEAYQRNITARAFDVARYLLFLGIPTGVGQVTSIRTLERQIRRLKSSPYAEIREVAAESAEALAQEPACLWDEGSVQEAVAPSLAKYLDADEYAARFPQDVAEWAKANLPAEFFQPEPAACGVDLTQPTDTVADIAATLLYPATTQPFRHLYETVRGWSRARQMEVLETALRSRTSRDELPRHFRAGLLAFDIVMDVGAYRDLHRHRRCQQFHQGYGWKMGFETPPAILQAGLGDVWKRTLDEAASAAARLPEPSSHYLLPFAARSRFLFKMDFAEAEYISKLRSGVKGHFSYREIAWQMKKKMEELNPDLGRLINATPPWVEDPLNR